MKQVQICCIGCGNMGRSLIGGILANGYPRQLIRGADPAPAQREAIRTLFGIEILADNLPAIEHAEIVILAVKPQLMAATVKNMAPSLVKHRPLIISIAAGISLDAIESCARKDLKLIRVMPNICVSAREGASAIAGGKHAVKEDLMIAKTIFDSVGKSLFIEESLLDAVTGLSGSGPAYIFLIIDALADAGVKVGLSRDDALILSSQTVLGAAKMLIETGEHPGKLKDMVTSPGGTAIAGLHTLEEGGLRTTLINAVEVATQRSKVLGEMMKNNLIKK